MDYMKLMERLEAHIVRVAEMFNNATTPAEAKEVIDNEIPEFDNILQEMVYITLLAMRNPESADTIIKRSEYLN